MKVSQELKDEFVDLKTEVQSVRNALNRINDFYYAYPLLFKFMFKNNTYDKDDENILTFVKWWAGEEEIENNEKLRQFEKFKKRVDDDV